MKLSRLPRLVAVIGLAGMAVGAGMSPADATNSVPRLIYVDVSDRLVDVDSSNDGLTAYTVTARIVNGNPTYDGLVRQTTNAGLDWSDNTNAPLGHWLAVSTSTSGSTVAIAGSTDASTHALHVSTDSGTTWTPKGPTTSPYLDVAVASTTNTIVAARATDGVSFSSDGGNTWTQVDSDTAVVGIQPLLADDVAVSTNGQIMVASKFAGTIWRSTNGGGTWVDLHPASSRNWSDLAMSDDGLTVFGVVESDKGYIWDGAASTPAWISTGDLQFVANQGVQAAISPDGNSFIATSFSAQPRILRNWDRSSAAAAASWPSVIENTSTENFYVAQVLGITMTNGGANFILVNEQRGIQSMVPTTPAPVITGVTSACTDSIGGPTSGGTMISIFGRYLYEPILTIGGQQVATANNSSGYFSATTPAGSAGTAEIVLTTPGGSLTIPGGFTYVDLPDHWSRIGSTIAGKVTGEYAGASVATSADGNTIAFGAPRNDGGGTSRGQVRVYDWNGTTWTQRGSDISGTVDGDRVGVSIALSADGNILAVGSTTKDAQGTDSGQVRVFQWSDSAWVERGNPINGENAEDRSGNSVALSSDGNTLAIGATLNDSSGRADAGHVRVYTWQAGAWTQRGDDLDGEASGDNAGKSVALNADGTIVAFGSPLNDQPGRANDGSVRVFGWDEVNGWTQLGNDIDGTIISGQLGTAVDLSSTGRTVAVGAPFAGNGRVKVFDLAANTWTQIGSDMVGANSDSWAGSAVALSSDGTVVSFGSPRSCRFASRGSITVMERQGTEWTRRGDHIESMSPTLGMSGLNLGGAVTMNGSGSVIVGSTSWLNTNTGAVFAWRYAPPFVFVPPSASTPSTTTPGTTTPPAPIGPPSASSRDTLPVGDPAALFGRAAPAGGAFPLRVGEQLNVTLDDFTPNENVWIGLFSDPVTIATVKANARGVLSTAFTIPSGITGDHTLVIYGTESGNGVRIPVQLTAPNLPVTGPNTSGSPGILSVLATLILTLGLSLVFWVAKTTVNGRFRDPEHRSEHRVGHRSGHRG